MISSNLFIIDSMRTNYAKPSWYVWWASIWNAIPQRSYYLPHHHSLASNSHKAPNYGNLLMSIYSLPNYHNSFWQSQSVDCWGKKRLLVLFSSQLNLFAQIHVATQRKQAKNYAKSNFMGSCLCLSCFGAIWGLESSSSAVYWNSLVKIVSTAIFIREYAQLWELINLHQLINHIRIYM